MADENGGCLANSPVTNAIYDLGVAFINPFLELVGNEPIPERSYDGFGSVLLPEDAVVPAIAPTLPWESTTCPEGGYALHSSDLGAGKYAWFCTKGGMNAAPSDPEKYIEGDAQGHTGFWTIGHMVAVGIGVSIGLTLLVSLIPTPKRKKRDEDDADDSRASEKEGAK